VSTSSNPPGGGTTSGGGTTFTYNQNVTVTATPNAGYSFVNWTENSTVVSTDAGYNFNVTANRTLQANFSAINYSVSTSSNPSGGGTTSGDGAAFTYNQSVTVAATANSGYRFVNWTENSTVISTNSSYSFNVIANRNLVANFIQTLTVSTSQIPAEGGLTSGGGTYDYGSSVTVMASSATGYRFVNWTEGGSFVSSNSSYSFSVTTNRSLTANFIQTFTVATSSSPGTGGTTSGSGIYDSGSSVTVSASSSTGYRFVNWTEGGSFVSSSSSYTFAISSNRSLTANFIQTYSISVSASPGAGGSTTGSGIYDTGSQITVTATAASGYRFVSWTENGSVVSTISTYSFIASANRVLVANFIQTFVITTSANPVSGGTSSGGGTFDSGTLVTVTAAPSVGFRFVNWTEGGSSISTSSSYTFNITANRSLTANFIQTYTISTAASPVAGGSTAGGGTYDSGSQATVTATSAAGYRFVNWTEGGSSVSTSTSYSFTVSASRSLTANFIRTYNILTSSSPTAGGSTSGSGTYDTGSSVTVTATPSINYRFVNWTEGGTTVSTSTGYSFTASVDRSLVANFIRTYTISTSSSPAAGGTTTGGGTFDSGASVTVIATPSTGYRFINWTEGSTVVSTGSSYSFTASATRSLVANFIRTYTISTSSIPAAGGSTAGGGTYDTGSSVTVTATPATGYRFVSWTEGGSTVSATEVYSFIISSSRTLTANFIQIFTIATSSNPAAGGSVSGSGTYDTGSSITVTATPATGYRFVNWTEGGSAVSTSASYIFAATANRTLVANFIRIFSITTSSNPSGGGTTSGDGIFDSGVSVTVTAIPATGYRFVNWTESGLPVSTIAGYTFSAAANRTLVANFIQTFTVSTSPSPSSGGTTTGTGTFDTRSLVTVTATPAVGYRFVNWTDGSSEVSSGATYTFEISSDRVLTAHFIRIFTVSTSSSPSGGGTTAGGGTYDTGTSVTISATASPGYRFVNWMEGSNVVSTSSSFMFELTSNRTFTASFIRIFTIRTSSNPQAGGTTTGGGTFDTGTSVTIMATPASGYRFISWTEGGTSVSTSAGYTFTASENRTLTANFIQTFTITTSSVPTAGGSTTGTGTYDSGTLVTVTATPSAGYRFDNWTESGSAVSSNASYSFTISSNRNISASFSRITCTVRTSSVPAAGGTTSGGGTLNWGSSVTVNATATLGYRFVNWTESGSAVSTNTSYTFTLIANRSLVANFSLIPVIFKLTGPDGKTLHNNDTIKLDLSYAGSFSAGVESNFNWTVNDNSVWLNAVKESNTSVKVTYLENISVVNKTASIIVENELKNIFQLYVQQKARVSQLHLSKFDDIKIYPNPANNVVYLGLGENEFEKINISITSIQGNIVSEKEYENLSTHQVIGISVSRLIRGHYLLNVSDGSGHKSFNLIKY
jgi:hypothetical protein